MTRLSNTEAIASRGLSQARAAGSSALYNGEPKPGMSGQGGRFAGKRSEEDLCTAMKVAEGKE